jgi:hypothetical protein
MSKKQTTLTNHILGQTRPSAKRKSDDPILPLSNSRKIAKVPTHGSQNYDVVNSNSAASQNEGSSGTDIGSVVNQNNKMLEYLIQNISKYEQRVTDVEKDVTINKQQISSMNHRLNLLEQEKLSNKLEISGLDTSNVTNPELKDTLVAHLNSIAIKIDSTEIIDLFRVERKVGTGTMSVIIVTFSSHDIKLRVIRDKISRDKATGTVCFYAADALTKDNRHLFMLARQYKKNGYISSAWTMGGSIFVAMYVGGQRIKIHSEEQLRELMECNNEQENTHSLPTQNPNVPSTSANALLNHPRSIQSSNVRARGRGRGRGRSTRSFNVGLDRSQSINNMPPIMPITHNVNNKMLNPNTSVLNNNALNNNVLNNNVLNNNVPNNTVLNNIVHINDVPSVLDLGNDENPLLLLDEACNDKEINNSEIANIHKLPILATAKLTPLISELN